ncbi:MULTISPECIES: PrsW family intramembrane metalloprotease [unclassified Coleofasciculus]|uniref:PrsW family intramembrane metalloprotease n=1 Tax=unclassified Coleofasciculus TaxID=2692782 RepID=UPI00187E005F|nr:MULTISPECIES: PrsW family intramembrane metalloprotease [unclassified Coleofasciculus]MBE9125554.1 PrsW family intramembrane metalloprotease [Coleofasciculus sp. LEGE 07081]MBE9147811.1 PrsW family intramembrane metalloprotease [Coleofasciculus sp. LEGE 07092]
MERYIITAIALAIPAYFYTWLVRTIDRFEKEPVLYLIAAFLWGAVPAVVFALVLQLVFSVPVNQIFGQETLQGQLIEAAVSAPVTEEILKGMAVAIVYLRHRREFDGWVDGIVYGATAGFGFAYVENIIYLTSTQTWQDWGALFFLRAIVFGGMHGFWSALVGIGFGFARYSSDPLKKVLAIACGLMAAISGHLIHNGAITLIEKTSGLTLIVALFNYAALGLLMVVLWFVAGYVEHQRLRTYLREEVPDFISPECYEALCKHRSDTLAALGMSLYQRRALFQVAAELAQKKLQLSKMGEEEGNSRQIAHLRQELRRLGRQRI